MTDLTLYKVGVSIAVNGDRPFDTFIHPRVYAKNKQHARHRAKRIVEEHPMTCEAYKTTTVERDVPDYGEEVTDVDG